MITTEHFEFDVDHIYNTLRWYSRDEYSARNKIFKGLLEIDPSEVPDRLLIQPDHDVGRVLPPRKMLSLIAQATIDSNHAPTNKLQDEFGRKLNNDFKRYQIKAANRIQSSLTDYKNGKINRIEARSQFDSARLSMKHMGVQAIKTRTQQITQSSVVESAMETGEEELIFRTKAYKACSKCKALNGKHFKTEDVKPLEPNVQNALGVPDKDQFKPRPARIKKPYKTVEDYLPEEFSELTADEQRILGPYMATMPPSLVDSRKLVSEIKKDNGPTAEARFQNSLPKALKVKADFGLSEESIARCLTVPDSLSYERYGNYKKDLETFIKKTGIDPRKYRERVLSNIQRDMPTDGHSLIHYAPVTFSEVMTSPRGQYMPSITDETDEYFGQNSGVFGRLTKSGTNLFEKGRNFSGRGMAFEYDLDWIKKNRLVMARGMDRVNYAVDNNIPGFDKSNIPGSKWSKTLLRKYSTNKQNECYVVDDLPLKALKKVLVDPNASQFRSYLRMEKRTEKDVLQELKNYYNRLGVRVEIVGEEPLRPTKVKLTDKAKSLPKEDWSKVKGKYDDSINYVIAGTTKDGKEHGYLTDPAGNYLGNTAGTENGISNKQVKILLSDAKMKGCILTHSHPQDGCFSKDDLFLSLTNPNIGVSRVVNSKSAFYLKRTDTTKTFKGSETEFDELSKVYDKAFKNSFRNCMKSGKYSEEVCFGSGTYSATASVSKAYELEFEELKPGKPMPKVVKPKAAPVKVKVTEKPVPLPKEDWSVVLDMETEYDDGLKFIQRKSQETGNEWGAVLDKDGKMLASCSGSDNLLPWKEVKKMLAKAGSKGVTFMHTHPHDGCFSSGDFTADMGKEKDQYKTFVVSNSSQVFEYKKTNKTKVVPTTDESFSIDEETYKRGFKYIYPDVLRKYHTQRDAFHSATLAGSHKLADFHHLDLREVKGMPKPLPIVTPVLLKKTTSIPKEFYNLPDDDQIVAESYFALLPNSVIDKKALTKHIQGCVENITTEARVECGIRNSIKDDILKKSGLKAEKIRQILLTPGSVLESDPTSYMKFKDAVGFDPVEYRDIVAKVYQKDMPTEDYRFVHYGNVSFRKKLTAANATPNLTITDDEDLMGGLANGVYFRASPNNRDAFEAGTGFEFRPVALELDPKWVKENRLAYTHDYDKGMVSKVKNYNRSNNPLGSISADDLKRVLGNRQNEVYILDDVPLSALKQVTINPNAELNAYDVKTEKERDAAIKKLQKHYEDMGVKVVISKRMSKAKYDEWAELELDIISSESDTAEYASFVPRSAKAVLPEIFEGKRLKKVSPKEGVTEGWSIPTSIKSIDKITRNYAAPHITTIPDSMVDKEVVIQEIKRLYRTGTLDSIYEKAIRAGIKKDIVTESGLSRKDIAKILISPEGTIASQGPYAEGKFEASWKSMEVRLKRNSAIRALQKDMPTEDYKLVQYSDDIFGFSDLSPHNTKVRAKLDPDLEEYGLGNIVFMKAVSNKDNAADPDLNFGKRGIIVEVDPKWVKENRIVNFHPKEAGTTILAKYNENTKTGSTITKGELGEILKTKTNVVHVFDNIPPEAIKKVTIDPDASIWNKITGDKLKGPDNLVIDTRKKAMDAVKSKCKGRNIKFEVLKKGAISSPIKDKKLAETMGEVRQSIKTPKVSVKDDLPDSYAKLDKNTQKIMDPYLAKIPANLVDSDVLIKDVKTSIDNLPKLEAKYTKKFVPVNQGGTLPIEADDALCNFSVKLDSGLSLGTMESSTSKEANSIVNKYIEKIAIANCKEQKLTPSNTCAYSKMGSLFRSYDKCEEIIVNEHSAAKEANREVSWKKIAKQTDLELGKLLKSKDIKLVGLPKALETSSMQKKTQAKGETFTDSDIHDSVIKSTMDNTVKRALNRAVRDDVVKKSGLDREDIVESIMELSPKASETSEVIDKVLSDISKPKLDKFKEQYKKNEFQSEKDIAVSREVYVEDPISLFEKSGRDKSFIDKYKKEQKLLIDEWQSTSNDVVKKKLYDSFKKTDHSASATVAYSKTCFKRAHPKGTTVYAISTVSSLDDLPVGKSIQTGFPPLSSVIESEDAAFLRIAELKKKGIKASLVKTTIQEKDVFWDSRFGGDKKHMEDGEIMIFPGVKSVTKVISTRDVPKEPSAPVKVKVVEVPQKLPEPNMEATRTITSKSKHAKDIEWALSDSAKFGKRDTGIVVSPDKGISGYASADSKTSTLKTEDVNQMYKAATSKGCAAIYIQPSEKGFGKDTIIKQLTNPNVSTTTVLNPSGLYELKITKQTKFVDGTKRDIVSIGKLYDTEFDKTFSACAANPKFSPAQCFEFGSRAATTKVANKYNLEFDYHEAPTIKAPEKVPIVIPEREKKVSPWKEENIKPFSKKKLKDICETPKEFLDLSPQEQSITEPYFALTPSSIVDKKYIAKKIIKERNLDENPIGGLAVKGIEEGIKDSFLKKSGLTRNQVKQMIISPGSVYLDDEETYLKFKEAAGYDPLELQKTVAKTYQKDMPTEGYRFVHYGSASRKEFDTSPAATPEIGAMETGYDRMGTDNGVFFRATPNENKAFEAGRGFGSGPVAIELDPKWVKENRIAFMSDIDSCGTAQVYNRVNVPGGTTSAKELKRISNNMQNEVYVLDNVPLSALKQVTINPNAAPSFFDCHDEDEKEAIIKSLDKHYKSMGVKVDIIKKISPEEHEKWVREENTLIGEECKKTFKLLNEVEERKEFKPIIPEIIGG